MGDNPRSAHAPTQRIIRLFHDRRPHLPCARSYLLQSTPTPCPVRMIRLPALSPLEHAAFVAAGLLVYVITTRARQ